MAEKELLLNALLGLSMIVEARDPYTGGHLWRVSQFSKLLAQHAGLSCREVALCEIGGFLHDLGKIGVPDAILHKPDRLTDKEFSVIRIHPAVGGKLLTNHPLANLAIDAVVSHHERPDGKGYPDMLSGDELPLEARIIAVADVYSALTAERAHRRAVSPADAKQILVGAAGTQLDAELARLFCSLI